MGKLQDEIDAQNLWDLDAQVDVSMEALPLDDSPARTFRAASGGAWRLQAAA